MSCCWHRPSISWPNSTASPALLAASRHQMKPPSCWRGQGMGRNQLGGPRWGGEIHQRVASVAFLGGDGGHQGGGAIKGCSKQVGFTMFTPWFGGDTTGRVVRTQVSRVVSNGNHPFLGCQEEEGGPQSQEDFQIPWRGGGPSVNRGGPSAKGVSQSHGGSPQSHGGVPVPWGGVLVLGGAPAPYGTQPHRVPAPLGGRGSCLDPNIPPNPHQNGGGG